MTSHVELQTTQSVNHATGTPQPTLDRQLCFDLMLIVLIYSPKSGCIVAAAVPAASRLFTHVRRACSLYQACSNARGSASRYVAAIFGLYCGDRANSFYVFPARSCCA